MWKYIENNRISQDPVKIYTQTYNTREKQQAQQNNNRYDNRDPSLKFITITSETSGGNIYF
jgi:hypothetical protein